MPKDRPKRAEVLADTAATHLADARTRAHRAQVRALKAEALAEDQRRRRRLARVVGGSLVSAAVLGACVWLWVDHQRAERERSRRAGIETALLDTSRLSAAGDWSAAEAAAERAIELGYEGNVAEEVRAEAAQAAKLARQRAEDEAFLAELEEIRGRVGSLRVAVRSPRARSLRRGAGFPAQAPSREAEIRAVDAAYARAFQVRFGSPDAGAERLASSHVAAGFAANLGFWAWLRRTKAVLAGSDWRTLDRLVRRLEPGHDEVRDALIDRDEAALLGIAEAGGENLPGALVLQIGFALADLGHGEDAIALLDASRRRHPTSFWVHMRLGQAAHDQQDHALAARHLAVAAALRPRHALAWNHLGWSLHEAGDVQGAHGALRKALELAPDSGVIHSGLGAVLAGTPGRHDEALPLLRRALELDPALVHTRTNIAGVLLVQGKDDEAIDLAREILGDEPGNHLAHTCLGRAYEGKGQGAEAVEAYRSAAQYAPDDDVRALDDLARSLGAVGRTDEALEVLSQLIQHVPESALAHSHLGSARVRAGDLAGAATSLHRAIELDPDLGEPHIGLGEMHQAKGEYGRALAAFQRALTIDPQETRARYHLGILLCDDMRRYDAAIEQFRKILEVDPTHVAALTHFGIALRNKGERDAAIAKHEAAIRIAPDAAASHAALGVTLLRKGDLAGARRALERARELDGGSARTCANLAIVLRRQGERREAQAAFAKAVKLDPKDAWIRRMRGKFLLAQPDARRAVQQLQRAITLRPNDRGTMEDLGRARWLAPREARVIALLSGDAESTSWQEVVQVAELALLHLDDHATGSMQLYEKAFALHPPLAEDARAQHRYNAACAAALAGPDTHAKALAWLREELGRMEDWLDTGPTALVWRLEHWKRDRDLTSIRDRDDLPQDFAQLWTAVDALLERGREALK